MARIDSLRNFLNDVATAIKTKKGVDSSEIILAKDFDTEINNLSSGNNFELNNSFVTNGVAAETIKAGDFVSSYNDNIQMLDLKRMRISDDSYGDWNISSYGVKSVILGQNKFFLMYEWAEPNAYQTKKIYGTVCTVSVNSSSGSITLGTECLIATKTDWLNTSNIIKISDICVAILDLPYSSLDHDSLTYSNVYVRGNICTINGTDISVTVPDIHLIDNYNKSTIGSFKVGSLGGTTAIITYYIDETYCNGNTVASYCCKLNLSTTSLSVSNITQYSTDKIEWLTMLKTNKALMSTCNETSSGDSNIHMKVAEMSNSGFSFGDEKVIDRQSYVEDDNTASILRVSDSQALLIGKEYSGDNIVGYLLTINNSVINISYNSTLFLSLDGITACNANLSVYSSTAGDIVISAHRTRRGSGMASEDINYIYHYKIVDDSVLISRKNDLFINHTVDASLDGLHSLSYDKYFYTGIRIHKDDNKTDNNRDVVCFLFDFKNENKIIKSSGEDIYGIAKTAGNAGDTIEIYVR